MSYVLILFSNYILIQVKLIILNMKSKATQWMAVIVLAILILYCNSAHAQWSANGNHIYNNNTGNVGIGNSTPGFLLHTAKNMGEPTICIQNLGGGGGATFQMKDDLSGADWKFKATTNGGFKIRDNANLLDVIVVEPNSSANVIYINQNGNLGIGISNPQNNLSVVGDIIATDSIMVENGRMVEGDFRGASLNGVINCGGAMRNYTNALSDVTNPSIQVAPGDEDLYIQDVLEVGNQAYKPGGGSWAVLSDARLKKNVEPFTDGLTKVMQIRPVSFQYNEKSGVIDREKRYIGILAQDMLAVAPYMVEEKPLGQKVMEIENGVDVILEPGTMAYTFDPSALDYLIINAIQEQQDQLETMQQRINSLEREYEKLKAEIENNRSGTETVKK